MRFAIYTLARACMQLAASMIFAVAVSGLALAKPNQAPSVAMTAPANGATFSTGAPITLSATASDSDGTVAKVDFFRGGTTLIGTVTATPYTYQWTNATAGSYSLTAKATDNLGATKVSAAVNIVVSAPANNPPTVSLTAPANGATFTAPATVTLGASASDSDGTIAKVEFYQGSTLMGTSTAAPHSFVWASVAAGSYTLTAKAFDNLGATRTSTPIGITVGPANLPPLVVLTAPPPCTNYDAPASIYLTADAIDLDGTIASVGFYRGSTLIGIATTPPYSTVWTNVDPATYSLTARALDNRGAVTDSTPITIFVRPTNQPPVVQLTSPADGAGFDAPATIVLSATATDPDGSIARVEFYNGSSLLATRTAAPYTFTWNGVAAGSYALTARAVDNLGASASCAAIHVSVVANSVPVVSVSSPADGSRFNDPASIALSATASDADGTISAVDLIVDGTTIATRNAPPYSFDWMNPPAGAHSIQARATDNRGASGVSGIAHITVNKSPVVTMTAPTSGTGYAAPATIQLAATASTATGNVSRVDFYQGMTLIGTATTSPYAFAWSNVPVGNYSVTAKATNSAGLSATSNPVTIAVLPITTTVTSPASGANVHDSEVIVKGTFTGLPPDSVAVNGVPARLGASTFAALVPIQLGANQINVATTASGGTVNQSFGVTRVTPSVVITNLSNGQTVNDDTVTVIGTAVAPANSAVSVNGHLATLAPDGSFFLNDVPLEPGANTISVLLNTPEVAASQQTIAASPSVRAKAAMPDTTLNLNRNGLKPFELTVGPVEGFAPLTVNIKLTNRLVYVYDQLLIDSNGDGHVDYAEDGAPFPILERNFTMTYATPGVYPLTLTLTRQGSEIVYTATKVVHVMSPPVFANRLRSLFDDMLDRLAVGDITRASTYFTNTIRQRYNDAFTRLGPTYLTRFVENVGSYGSAAMSEDFGEIAITRTAQDGPLGFSVLLIRDIDGIWRIDGM